MLTVRQIGVERVVFPDMSCAYTNGDKVVSVDGRDLVSHKTMYQLMHDAYPDSMEQLRWARTSDDEDEVLLRPSVRRVARLYYDRPTSAHTEYFSSWGVAMDWAMPPFLMTCPAASHVHTASCLSAGRRCQ